MEAPKHIPGSQTVPELTTPTTTNTSSSRKAQRGGPLALRIAARPFHWFKENSFAPNFLTGAMAHPALGYLVAFVFQLVMCIAVFVLVHFYPDFRFLSVPLILVILLVALGWGAGPSIVALLIGAVLLLFFVLPPIFSFSIAQLEDGIGIGLYVAVGLTISIFASNIERARRTSEQLRQRLDTIIDAIPDSLAIYDAEGRRIQQNRVARELGPEVNPPLTLAQIASQLATRRSSGQLLPLEDLPLARALRGEVVVGAELLYRVPVKQQDQLVAISAAPLYSPSGKTIEGAVTITHDLSERKQIEDDLRASDEARQLLAAIVVSSNDAIIGKTIEGIVTSWNAAAEKMYGYTAEEMVGQSVTLLFPAGHQEEFAMIMEKIKNGERVGSYDTTRVRKNGSVMAVSVTISPVKDAEGKIVGASAIARDISEQKRLEAELRRSKQQLEVIFANIADGISVQDGNGRLIFINEAGAKRSGYLSAEDALQATGGHALRAHTEQRFEMLDEQGNPLPYEELPGKRALRGEKAPQAIVQYYDKVTRARQWSLVKARTLVDATGQVELAITIFSDVTETYEEKRRKDEFIGMASHELKTPVTSLKGFAQVLQRHLQKQGDERVLHYIARMDAQLNKLTKLIGDLLDVSKMQAGKLTYDIEPFELDALILETVENVQAATPTHQICVEGRTHGCILGDKDRLGQVFINLLTNAVKYSPNAEKVLVHLSADKQQAIVCVQDLGIGIDAAHHQKIFERFYQVTDPEEKTFPGLGMGLYISSEIVERHHGRMWVESRKGEGSTFSVALPLIQEV